MSGGIAGAAAGATVWLGPRMSTWNECLGLCVLFAPVLLAWATGTAARTRRAYLAGLVERAGRLEREREALAMVAVAEERERIARELHDIVAHSVSVMVVQSDGADAALQQRNTAEVRKAVAAIGRTGRDALTELRLLLGMLRSDDETGGPAAGHGSAQGPDREHARTGSADGQRPAARAAAGPGARRLQDRAGSADQHGQARRA